ncbi:MAG: 1-acyl-sn-glycerol-3-phosphate acyltransferase [Vicinamibacterales bacterium]
MTDEITQAVFARDEVAKFLDGSHGLRGDEARARVEAYLDELRTTQRYELYRALEYPLYPILRKLERHPEHERRAVDAAAAGHRLVYASNHRSHMDYLVELLVLDDAGLRPPVIAAGINLFGGPLGLIHRHVTGALPIRRNTKDPAYHITLKAYVAELLRTQDFFFYPEGGRSYSGELKSPKTGLLTACLQAAQPGLVVVPVAIAYDLVLEDHVLARQKVKKRQRAFSREVAEMVRYAVGYRSRAFVTFGTPIAVTGYQSDSRTSALDLGHRVMADIGRLVKVLPTALVAAAMRPSIPDQALADRITGLLEQLRAAGANLGVDSAAAAIDGAAEALEARGVIARELGRFRVRDRTVLRYYARSIAHLLPPAAQAR